MCPVVSRTPMNSAVQWTDVGPRDGLQNIAQFLPTEAKVRLVEGLVATGVTQVEATSFVSPKLVPQLADCAEVMGALSPAARAKTRVLIPNQRGLELALASGARRVVVTIGVTDSFNLRNVNKKVADSLAELDAIVGDARTAQCVVDVALSVSFGCPFDGHVDPARVVDLATELRRRGVAEVSLADTIGVAHPQQVRELCQLVGGAMGSDLLSVHMHDTRGLGVANVLAAYDVGIRRFDGSVGGIGGCPFAPRSTGNVCSEDALGALQAAGCAPEISLAAYCDVARQLSTDLGMDLPGKLYRAGIWDEGV